MKELDSKAKDIVKANEHKIYTYEEYEKGLQELVKIIKDRRLYL